MKLVFVSMISLVTFQASAAIDCDIKTGLGEKKTEAKADFALIKNDKGIASYETKKDGYTFYADVQKKEASAAQQLEVQIGIFDPSSNKRSVAASEGLKLENTNPLIMTALVDEKAIPPKFAKLTCRFK